MDYIIISQYYSFMSHFYRDILKDHPDDTILEKLVYLHYRLLEEYRKEESITNRANLELFSSLINSTIYDQKYKCIKYYKCIDIEDDECMNISLATTDKNITSENVEKQKNELLNYINTNYKF